MSTWRLLIGDVREQLDTLETASVQCIVTSPPYWGLRDYGHDGQIGLESTPVAYVEALVDVFSRAWRVLKDDGVLWLNLGDSYAHSMRQSANYAGDKQNSNAGSLRDGFAPIPSGLKEERSRRRAMARRLRDTGGRLVPPPRHHLAQAEPDAGERD